MPYTWVDTLLDVLLSPALWLGILLAVAYSLLFTAWRGGGWRQAPRDLLAGLVGFWLGQLASGLLHVDVLRVGEIRLLGATVGAVLGLLAGRVLQNRLQPQRRASATAKGRTGS